MNTAVEKIRSELQNMDAAGATVAEMETYMSNQAMKGGDFGLAWSAYLSSDKPDSWLEDFIND